VTKFLTTIILLFGQYAFGQSADSVTTIIISYGRNHGSWGEPGIYARSETIQFTKTSTDDYKISRYYRVNASAGNDGKTFRKDTIELTTKEFGIIPKEKIIYWLTQLNTNKENFTVGFIKPLLKQPARREIYQAAKKYDLLWKLKGSDADKADTKKAINDIQSFYKFDSFIIFKRPTIEFDMVVVDSYNGLRISTIKNSDTTEYRCQFNKSLGQPIVRYNHKDYSTSTKVFNLEANTWAQTFLPTNSVAKKVLDINNIEGDYIKWYLDKVMDE
jgi:hypothetical protein